MAPVTFSTHQLPTFINSFGMLPKRAVFEQVFSVLKHEWVYNFFFNSQEDELDQLRHAVTKDIVSTAELDITTLAPSNHETFQVDEHHRFLLIPSFTTGNITVGFAVNEKIASSSTIVSRDHYIGRIARDDDNGTCLFISPNFNDYITEVSFYSLVTPAHRQQIFSLFHTSRFNSVMKKLRHSYDPAALIPALIYCYCAAEARPCPKCGVSIASAQAPCPCRLQICRKRHPDDAEREMINMSSFLGGYVGVATVGLFTHGKTVYNAEYTANSGIRLTVDPDSQRRLARWALCSTIQKRSISPLALRMAKVALGEKGISAIDTFLLASIADSVTQEQQKSPKSTTSTLSLPQPYDGDEAKGKGSHYNTISSDQGNRGVPDDFSSISRPCSVFFTPAPSETSVQTSLKRSTTTPLVDDTHSLAPLLHPFSMPSISPIIAPVLIPPREKLPVMQHHDGPAARPHSTVEEESSSSHQARSPIPDNLSQNRTPLIPMSRPKEAAPLRACIAAGSQAPLPPIPEQLTQSTSHSLLTTPFECKNIAHSQLFPQKLPIPPEVSSISRPQTTSESRVPLHHSLPLHPQRSWQPPMSLHPPVQRGSQPPLHSHIPLPPQMLRTSHAQLQPQTPSALHTSVLQSQRAPSLSGQQVMPLAPTRLAATQPQQPMIQSQHAPLIRPLRLSSLPSRQATAMPEEQGMVPPLQAPHVQPHSAPATRPPHAPTLQPLHASAVLSQSMNSSVYPSVLRTDLDRSMSASARTGSEMPTIGSGLSDMRVGSELSVERAQLLRPAFAQAKYILPFRIEDSGPVCGRVNKIACNEVDERRVKAELRKARNRESAQRSNHKRKLKIQALKDDIAAVAKRELLLREKEKVLREENRTLKRTVKNDC